MEKDEQNRDMGGIIKSLAPPMNITVPENKETHCIIADDQLLSIYGDILDTIRQDRVEVSSLLDNFSEMVFNEGDGSNASKEAIASLMKIKTDLPDKMIKIADLMTRLKLKDSNTYKPYLTAKQENNININETKIKKEMLRMLNSTHKKGEREKDDGK